MDSLFQELRFATRSLLRSPSFLGLALATLALGIAANTGFFSAVTAVLPSPLPFVDSDPLAAPGDHPLQNPQRTKVARPNCLEGEERSKSFDEIAASRSMLVTLTGDPAERVMLALVSRELFEVLGVEPVLGRTFTPEEDRPGATPVVLISHGLWLRRFGGDPEVVGKTIGINGGQSEVIGVMGPEFEFPHEQIEVWSALGLLGDQTENPVQTLAIATVGPSGGIGPGNPASAITMKGRGFSHLGPGLS